MTSQPRTDYDTTADKRQESKSFQGALNLEKLRRGSFQTINERSNEDIGGFITSGRGAQGSQGTNAMSHVDKINTSKSHDMLVATQIGDQELSIIQDAGALQPISFDKTDSVMGTSPETGNKKFGMFTNSKESQIS